MGTPRARSKPSAQERDILETILRAAVVPSVTSRIRRQEGREKVGLGMRPPAEVTAPELCVT